MSTRVWKRVAVLACLLIGACSSSTPEEEVRSVIAAAENAAEERDLSAVMDLVSDRYSDPAGNDKAAIRALMQGFFIVNQSVHLLMRIEELEFPSKDLATARLTVGMLGRQSAEEWAFAADVYEFDVRLIREDDTWRLQSATWRRPS
jgi:hypothetical protein